jgi:hypothetical protein
LRGPGGANICGDLNFNVSGLKKRITDAAAIARIYAARPEWDTILESYMHLMTEKMLDLGGVAPTHVM